ncbi:2'-5' rna ligase [hydrocarbon metagenome]|uniref:2'-5' rna ligase n=1 Tax=hydrocarbon metagenome TaxID=938273 RepID=A0A0W8E5B2_9ZZZZ
MRLFIAVQVPEFVKALASTIKDELSTAGADIKWVEHENYHLTIKFLGEVERKEIVNIREKLKEAAQVSTPFDLAVSRSGCFPGRNRPRVLYLGITGQTHMAEELARRIDAGLIQLGFEPDHRRRFHLTLGRFRSQNNKEKLLDLADNLQHEMERKFHVDQFHLMESQLSKHGPVYKVLETIKIS